MKTTNSTSILNATPMARFLLAGIVLFPASALFSQADLPFSSGSDGSDGALVIPDRISHRIEHAAAYDAARDEVVVFGGDNSGRLADTWVFDGATWISRLPQNSPSARYGHVMAYDAVRQEVVLFGGNASNGRQGDTWVWDGTDWTQKNPAISPSPRDDAVMAYDEVNQEIVLFGGYSANRVADTWTWDGTNWTNKNPSSAPSARDRSAMAWDGKSNRIILFGGYSSQSDTWAWDGTDWSPVPSATKPAGRQDHSMAYDAVNEVIVMTGASNSSAYTDTWILDSDTGWQQVFPTMTPTGGQQENRYDAAMAYHAGIGKVLHIGGYRRSIGITTFTLSWEGDSWNYLNGSAYYFDMRSRPTGIWNFTTIDIPSGVTVYFVRNSANTPVIWLASGDVQIDGNLRVNGQSGFVSTINGEVARSGPGGFDGGQGGIAFNISGSYSGTPGQGPGGGAAGTSPFNNNTKAGANGGYFGVYGNNFIVPFIGGAGGGGTAASETGNGAGAGAGGGAILIASSRDIALNGTINSKGGNRAYSSAVAAYSGYGSGGAVKLVADRLTGDGTIDVRGGNNGTGSLQGRIRLEAFERSDLLDNAHSLAPSSSAPVTDNLAVFLATQPGLRISQVAGEAVANPPSGDTGNPDVIFSSGGNVNIVVVGTNIPDGTPVTVRVTFPGGSTELPETGQSLMTGGSATVSGTIPSGVGLLEAYAEFTTN